VNIVSGLPGAVLAGGQSRRMGTNKALMEVEGKPMARLVADVLKEVCNEVVIVGGSKEEHSALGFPWFPDSMRDCGPLGGIYTALTLFENDVVVCACDLPNITPDLLKFLLSRDASAESSATVLSSGTMIQPLLGVYHQTCRPTLHHFLENGGRKVFDFLQQCTPSFADLASSPGPFSGELLLNINTMAEYRSRIER